MNDRSAHERKGNVRQTVFGWNHRWLDVSRQELVAEQAGHARKAVDRSHAASAKEVTYFTSRTRISTRSMLSGGM